jgi:N-glycosylase/DNA lyase
LEWLPAEILSTDVDLEDFWARCRSGGHAWAAEVGAGRFLRCPTVFDDLVALLCTTNCSWGRAVANVRAVCSLGPPTEPPLAFPYPESIVAATEAGLRSLGLGFRAKYLMAAAEAVIRGHLPSSRLEIRSAEPEEMNHRLQAIRGVGPYVAETLMRICGAHDFFGVDSWNVTCVPAAAKGERALRRRYARFGRWRGLAFWLDATRHWYEPGETWP